ncbi:hypothetical protein B0H19DRAFT_1374647 [Mycena capillaripes]|nr:hypothetical protein B0H19DRAFT_1374647 [Mycena capillaripes]
MLFSSFITFSLMAMAMAAPAARSNSVARADASGEIAARIVEPLDPKHDDWDVAERTAPLESVEIESAPSSSLRYFA